VAQCGGLLAVVMQLVGATNWPPTTQTENIQAFRVAAREKMHCANACRMGG
jgi:hypothetical protein